MLLEAVKVVEWSEDISPQFAARLLTDLGATTRKLEPPGGSAMRHRRPFWSQDEERGALFDFLNAGKTCQEIDPATPAGATALNEALDGANVLIESGLDEAFGSQGITLEKLRRSHPELVVLSITALGVGSDPAAVPDSDFLLQHRVGLAHAMARPVSDPAAQPPLAAADHEGPLSVGVCGALSAVWGLLAAQSGPAPRIDLATQDFYALLLLDEFGQWLEGERGFSRARGNRPGVAPAGGISWLLPTRDGHFLVSPREQHQWERWVEVIGQPAWAQDEVMCATVANRKNHWRELRDLMSEWSRTQSADDVAERAQAAGVACFPVSSPQQLLDNAQLIHRKFFDSLAAPGGPAIAVPGLPMQITDTAGQQLARQRQRVGPRLDTLPSSERSSNVSKA